MTETGTMHAPVTSVAAPDVKTTGGSMAAPDEKMTGGSMAAPDEKTTGGSMAVPDEKTTGVSMTAPDEKMTGGTMTSAQSTLALFALSGMSGTTLESKAEDATSAGEYDTMGMTTSRRGSMMPSAMDSTWAGPVPAQMPQPT
ncbi:uncharacterized protein LOC125940996 [Dermacentor silvarum]|uniref:uncharacterized protein LOC125940996 n=1 Tax=Dermacentor silvarum TaxID=543639 RepID=UPI002101C8CF|nr:uncharacterized protein LOC125940996 [Dermacentor silvarum]